MATNHTTNYQLNLWEANDNFVREEFNENTQKIDAALKTEADARTALAQTVATKADASTVTALQTTVNNKADQSALNTLTQTVNTKASTAALNALTQTVNAKAGTAALNALTQTVSKKLEFTSGTYVGTGEFGEEHPNQLDFAATVGRYPQLIHISSETGLERMIVSYNMPVQSALYHPEYTYPSRCFFTWTETGLRWYNMNKPYYQLNTQGMTYHYVAFF